MKRLVVLRHGETEWSASGRHTGRKDIPLTFEGERKARLLGQRLVHFGIEPVRVLSSPRQRALKTALLAGLDQHRIEATELLAELDYGEYEGRTTEEIRSETPSWNLFKDGCPGGETLEAAGDRADELLAEVAPEDGAGDVALVGHGHFSRILAARYLGLDASSASGFALDTASLSILGHEHEWRAVLLWNHGAGIR
ncbi:MAG TPA: histidine phosphatase family protein [Acidimicrobiales bacterium]|nr:histidine phosphatase family protein [Acidimicrobiales bacterium]